MYQKMLVPLDGSELAEVVFIYAKELAVRLDLEVILFYVYNPVLGQFLPMHRAYVERAVEIIRHQSKEVQSKKGARAGSKPVKVRGELTEGYPAEEILRYADENAIDLILMATHGRSGLKRWTIGSVADKVLSASKYPVWLVRAGIPGEIPYDKWPKITIVAPLDGSELAEAVLPHVEALAKQRDAKSVEVALLRICEPPVTPSYYVSELPEVPLNWGEYMQQETNRCKQQANDYLTVVEKRFRDTGISVQSKVLEGKAADEIVDYVKQNPFNLVVMATHGRSGLSRWIYGSITENILQGVTSPVLLIRTHQSDSEKK
ncbi:universal stress protein [Chloroflexota bacterium]